MIHNMINIEMDYSAVGIEHKGAPATITTYIRDMYPNYQKLMKRPLVVVCPGGGYEHHSPREGEPVAIELSKYGFNVVILRYSLMPNEYPCAMYEAAYTMKYVRDHAKEWDVDPDKIIIAGFSAGGHVAASLGTKWNSDEIRECTEKCLGVTSEYIKPNGMLLGYSVLTSGEHAHRMSFERLLGEKYEKLLDKVSLEKCVTEDTPETFMWHTFEDGSVPVENSLLFANSLRRHHIKFELHIFPNGSHGLGLGTKETDTSDGKHYQPECSSWVELFNTWVEKNR